MNRTFSHLLGAATLCALLVACTPAGPSASSKTQAESYIRTNVATLSPRSAVLGGRFSVTAIEWEDADTALVTYEDGHILLKGRTDISGSGSALVATRFKLVNDTNASSPASGTGTTLPSGSSATTPLSSASTSDSSSSDPRALRAEGAFCGGIAGFQCQAGLHCDIKETYPDAGGTCVKD